MRINRLITLISVTISIYIITSCSATQPRENMLIGTWKPEKVSPYTSPGKQKSSAIAGKKAADTTNAKLQNEETMASTTVADEKQADKLDHTMGLQMRATMKFNADKTCNIQFPGKLINASWKLKKKGTSLIVKDLGSDRKWTLKFVFLNDTTSMAIQQTDAGDIIVRYRKQ